MFCSQEKLTGIQVVYPTPSQKSIFGKELEGICQFANWRDYNRHYQQFEATFSMDDFVSPFYDYYPRCIFCSPKTEEYLGNLRERDWTFENMPITMLMANIALNQLSQAGSFGFAYQSHYTSYANPVSKTL